MLKAMRDYKKIIYWALAILVLPAFVLWGTGSVGRSKDGPACVGMIDNKKISFDDFSKSLKGVRTQLLLNFAAQPQILDSFVKNKAFLAKLAWDRIIMLREARKMKLRVNDKEVVQYIKFGLPAFSRNGRFDEQMYEYILRNNLGIDPRTFEELVRENLTIKKLNDVISKDAKATDEEILTEFKKSSEKYKLAYILIPISDFAKTVSLTDTDVRAYYDGHQNEFTIPADKNKNIAAQTIPFDSIKDNLRTMLAEKSARDVTAKTADARSKDITGIMQNEKLPFDQAASRLGLKPEITPFVSRTDYIDGVGEAAAVFEKAASLKDGELSGPVDVRKGTIIFTVSEKQTFDEEKFKKEKDEFAKKVLEQKKYRILEEWLRGLEMKSKVLIDFNDYDKYYR